MIANKIAASEAPYLLLCGSTSGIEGNGFNTGLTNYDWLYAHRIKSRSFTSLTSQIGTSNGGIIALGTKSSSNGSYIVVPSSSTIRWWTRSGNTYTYSGILSVSNGSNQSASWSSDGNYMAYGNSAVRQVYARSGSSLTAVTTANSTSSTRACALSSSGLYAAFATSTGSSPFLQIQSRSGTGTNATYQQMTIAAQPAGTVRSMAFSSDDQYLLVLHNLAPWITIYKLTSGVYVKESDINSSIYPVNILDSTSNTIIISPSGTRVAICVSDSTTSFRSRTSFYTFISGNLSLRSSYYNDSASVSEEVLGTWTPNEDAYITGYGSLLYFLDTSMTSYTVLATKIPEPTGSFGTLRGFIAMPIQ